MPEWTVYVWIVVALVGGLAAFVGFIFVATQRNLPKHLAFIRGVPIRRCGEVARDPRWGQYVAVEGRAVPGPAGPLIAPLSGRPCVWYEAELEFWELDDSGEYPSIEHTSVWKATAGEPFAVGDDSGQVAVSLRLREFSLLCLYDPEPLIETPVEERFKWGQRPGPHLSRFLATGVADPARLRSEEATSVGFNLIEKCIPPGKPLYVVAVPQPWNGYPVLAPTVPPRITAITTGSADLVHGRIPLPAHVRNLQNPMTGCGVVVVVVAVVVTVVALWLAYLALPPA